MKFKQPNATGPGRNSPMNFLSCKNRAQQTILALLLLCALPLLSACGLFDGPTGYHGSVVKDKTRRNFFLIDHWGHSRHLQDYRGKVVVLFFGYTHCPDICPTTLNQLATAVRQLGANARRVQVLFITLDPEHDSASVLADYLRGFHPDFIGLTGSPEKIRAAAREFSVYYLEQKTEQTPQQTAHSATASTQHAEGANSPDHASPAGQGHHASAADTAPVLLEHTTNSLVFDADGRLRLLFKATQEATEMAADLQRLLTESSLSHTGTAD